MKRSLHLNLDTPAKQAAHEINLDVWKALSRRSAFSDAEQYWTLCHHPTSEVKDVVDSGVTRPDQIHGVNFDKNIVERLQQEHPQIHLYLKRWENATYEEEMCPNGGIIYFDTTYLIDHGQYKKASQGTASTLKYSGPNTLVCANFCATKTHGGTEVFGVDAFLQNLPVLLDEETADRWRLVRVNGEFACYPRRSSFTQMVTFFFWSDQ